MSSFLIGLIKSFASDMLLALVVILSFTSSKLAYGAIVGFFNSSRSFIVSETVASPIPVNFNVLEKKIDPSEKLLLI